MQRPLLQSWGQATNRMSSVDDVKTVIAQCAGRYMFTIGLIKGGVITYPGDKSQQVLAQYSRTAQDWIAIANRLPRNDAWAEAKRFSDLQTSEFNRKLQNTQTKSLVKETMDETFAAIDRCIYYAINPTVLKLMKGH